MKLLLIESTPGNATEISAHLAAEGHEVVGCADEHGGPCRGTEHQGECPLEGHIDLAIVARDSDAARTLAEMGGVCATRRRVPMVEVDPTQVADELPSVAVARAVATRSVEAAYAAAVRHQLGHLPAIVEVTRTPGRIHAKVQVPNSENTVQGLSAVADRARQAVRDHDPFVAGIDVSVVCYPDPE